MKPAELKTLIEARRGERFEPWVAIVALYDMIMAMHRPLDSHIAFMFWVDDPDEAQLRDIREHGT